MNRLRSWPAYLVSSVGRVAEFANRTSFRRRFAAVGLCLVALCVVYPSFFTMKESPAASNSWAFADPAVVHSTFMPGHRVLRYEIKNNLNILWSSLRGLGLPLLGNDIQAAPLFPLTWLLMPIPEPYFWNCLVLIRLLLIGVGVFLIATELFGLSRTAGFFYVLSYGFALYVLRWMNHPYENGVAAGVWYFYSLGKLASPGVSDSSRFTGTRLLRVLLLSLTTYSVATCGFPESAGMVAVTAATAYPFFALGEFRKHNLKLRPFTGNLVIAHGIGFALASPQLFALGEFLTTVGPNYRTNYGVHQLAFDGIENVVTMLDSNPPPPAPWIHVFGLITVFFFAIGTIRTLAIPRRINGAAWGALACGLFYVLKAFPIWPWFNLIVSRLPLIQQSKFGLFYFPSLLFSFGYFVARGVEYVMDTRRDSPGWGKWLHAGLVISVLAAEAGFLAWIPHQTLHTAYRSVLLRAPDPLARNLALVFFATAFMSLFYFWVPRSKILTRSTFPLILIALAVSEVALSVPRGFFPVKQVYELFAGEPVGSDLAQIARNDGIPVHELRIQHPEGLLAASGIATPDDGATAILPERLKLLRTSLFKVDWEGYLPLQSGKLPYSWDAISTNLLLTQTPAVDLPSWPCPHCKPIAQVRNAGTLFWNPDALPRAWVPSRCVPVPDLKTAVERMSQPTVFNMGDALIEGLSQDEQLFCSRINASLKQVKILKDQGADILLDDVQGPTVVVLNDNYYPGWTARDEPSGQALEIKPANISFRALLLKEKRIYRIAFRYRPFWLFPAALMILASVCIILLLCWKAFRRPASAAIG